MKKSKILLVALCAVLLVTVSVLGTLAYLTDKDSVENTFTVGKVTLGDGDNEAGLDEAKVNEYGQPIDNNGNVLDDITKAPRVDANTYKLLPGHEYDKDPTVHVKNDSENSWIFITVDNEIADIEAASEKNEDGTFKENGYKRIADQIVNDDHVWTALVVDGVQVKVNGNPVYYTEWTKLTDTTGTTDLRVFSEFKIDGSVTADELANYANKTIIVNAYAIQRDGFDDVNLAWAELQGMLNENDKTPAASENP